MLICGIVGWKNSGKTYLAQKLINYFNANQKLIKNSDYLSMITRTFGKETAEHISKMATHKLKRKHNFEEVNY